MIQESSNGLMAAFLSVELTFDSFCEVCEVGVRKSARSLKAVGYCD